MKEALFKPAGGVGRVAEDAAEGALAGLVATAAMSLFTAAIMAAVKRAGRWPSRREREEGGEIIHWTFGVALGVVYGLLSSRTRRVRAGRGLAYGAAVFAGASEAALPALGLALPPAAYPPAGRALNLASHLVYGASLHAATQGLRSAAAALHSA